MKKNEGRIDRIIRLILGIVLASIATWLKIGDKGSNALFVVLIAVAAILLFTAASGSCLLYVPFGINTKGPE